MSYPDAIMIRPLDLGDVPELLVMMSKYLGINTLSRAVRVTRQWYRHLLLELWYWIHLRHHSCVGPVGPQLLRSLHRYGHFIHVLCLANVKTLDLFRPRPDHVQGDDTCLVNSLTRLLLVDTLSDGMDITGSYFDTFGSRLRLSRLMVTARADYELSNNLKDEDGNESGQVNKHGDSDGEDRLSEYYDATVLSSVWDNDDFEEHWEQFADDLINPPYFDPLIHLLRHNRHLRSLTVYHFPSWSEQAIRAICREGLPMLQELDLGSERSVMVSTRLMRILLEGLTPKLRTLKFWIQFLHRDDGPRMESKENRKRFWHRRYQSTHHNSKIMDLAEEMGLEPVENYELKELSINQISPGTQYVEQEGVLRSLIPYLRRCQQLERLELPKLPIRGHGLLELTSTLYHFCPRFSALRLIRSTKTFSHSIPDQLFEQVLLASQRGWKDIDLGCSERLSRFSIRTFMGTAHGKEISIGRRQEPPQWTSYGPSAIELRLAGAQEQHPTMDAAGLLTISAAKTASDLGLPQQESTLLPGILRIAIHPRLQILETLRIAGCTAITSHNIQTILCSCPLLRIFVALIGNRPVMTQGPFLKVQDMRRPLVAADGAVLGRNADDDDMSQDGSGPEPNEEEENENRQRQKWACLGLEVLCLRIELTTRPDIRVEEIGSRCFKSNNDNRNSDMQTLLDHEAMRVCRAEQRFVYRELGRLKRLRRLRLGQCFYYSWREQEHELAVCDFLDSTSVDLSITVEVDTVAALQHPSRPLSSATEVAESIVGNEITYEEEVILRAPFGSSASRAIVNSNEYQHHCLELNLESGLELMLRGTPQLEILEVPQMATRIGVKEVQAMAAAWPKLRQLWLKSKKEINWRKKFEVDLRNGECPTEDPPAHSIPSHLRLALAEAVLNQPTLAGLTMIECRDMILYCCLLWMKNHCPHVDIAGAQIGDDLVMENHVYPGDSWDRWDNIPQL